MKRREMLAVCGLAAPLLGATAHAGVVGFDAVTMIDAPASLMPGDVESDDAITVFQETSARQLAAPLPVDIVAAPGTYDLNNRLNLGEIAGGETIDSYMLHYDLVGSSGSKIRNLAFSITFDQPILGLIIRGDADWNGALAGTTLDDSDFLGPEGTMYPSNADGVNRGTLEASAAFEWLEVSPDGYTLSGQFRSKADHLDQVRVVTAGTIPAPGAVALAGAGLLCGVRRRSR